MSEKEIKGLEERIHRMNGRKATALGIKAEVDVIQANLSATASKLDAVIAEVDAEIQADMLRLDAERYEQ